MLCPRCDDEGCVEASMEGYVYGNYTCEQCGREIDMYYMVRRYSDYKDWWNYDVGERDKEAREVGKGICR